MKNKVIMIIACLAVISVGVLLLVNRTEKYGPEHLQERIKGFGTISELRRVDGDERNKLSDPVLIEQVFTLIVNNTDEVYYYDDYLSAPPPGGSEIIFDDSAGKNTVYLIYDPDFLPCDLAFKIVGRSDHKEEVLCCDLKKNIKSQIESIFLNA